jgi:SAM-dependent methyltransferase
MKKITRRNLEKFLKDYATDKEVLDIGSGGSSYDRYFVNRITVDIDPARNPDVVGDAHSLPFPDEKFDIVICTEVLEHLKNPQKAIDEMWRVLKDEGMVILTTRFLFPLHDVPNDYWRYTKYGLQHLFSSGWDILRIETETYSFSAIGALLQRMLLQMEFKADKVVKYCLSGLVWIFDHLNFLIEKEYGDYKKKSLIVDRCSKDKGELQGSIFATGYYLVARKSQPVETAVTR